MKKKEYLKGLSFYSLLFGVICVFPMMWFFGKLPDVIQVNLGNIAVLKHYSSDNQTKVFDYQGSARVLENAQVADARTQMKSVNLSDELYQAFETLQPKITSLTNLYATAEHGFSALAPFLLPADINVQLTRHTDGNGWRLLGISCARFSWVGAEFVLVFWWQKEQLDAQVAIPLQAQSVAPLFLSDALVGVPIGFTVLNADPRFTISAQLKNKRFSKSYPYPYLVNFQDLTMSGVRVCQARYALHNNQPESTYLELWPGCALDSPSYTMLPKDVFLLIDRFKTTEGCRGTLGVWWNVNVGNGTGGRYPNDWVTQVLLFDSLRENASNGRLQFAAYDGGTALLDFVFLLRIGVSEEAL